MMFDIHRNENTDAVCGAPSFWRPKADPAAANANCWSECSS
jgi:hypothetical protein